MIRRDGVRIEESPERRDSREMLSVMGRFG
jgi:hypothetical protein